MQLKRTCLLAAAVALAGCSSTPTMETPAVPPLLPPPSSPAKDWQPYKKIRDGQWGTPSAWSFPPAADSHDDGPRPEAAGNILAAGIPEDAVALIATEISAGATAGETGDPDSGARYTYRLEKVRGDCREYLIEAILPGRRMATSQVTWCDPG